MLKYQTLDAVTASDQLQHPIRTLGVKVVPSPAKKRFVVNGFVRQSPLTLFSVHTPHLLVSAAATLSYLPHRYTLASCIDIVENMWVQSRLVEGRLVVLAVRGGVAPLERPHYCLHTGTQYNTIDNKLKPPRLVPLLTQLPIVVILLEGPCSNSV